MLLKRRIEEAARMHPTDRRGIPREAELWVYRRRYLPARTSAGVSIRTFVLVQTRKLRYYMTWPVRWSTFIGGTVSYRYPPADPSAGVSICTFVRVKQVN